MGLINTIGNLANQAFNLDTLGSDFLDAVKQQVLGIKKQQTPTSDSINYSQYQSNTGSHFMDLRGTNSVYRGRDNVFNKTKSNYKQLFYMGRDFCWNEKSYNSSFADFQPQVQKIKIVEFQPFDQTFLGQAFYTFLNSKKGNGDLKSNAIGAMGGLGAGISDQPVVGQFGKILKNIMINNISKDPESLYKDDSYDIAMKDPFDAVARMFVDGIWLHTYVIPLLGTDKYTYLYNSGHQFSGLTGGGGEFGALVNMIGGKAAGDKMKGMDGLWKNIPSTPNFKAELKARPGIRTTFYLINKTSQDLIKNYRFLMAFASGTYNVQLQWGAMQSPNVYYVEIQGKRQMIWAQMQVQAKEIGKYRCDQYAYQTIAKEVKTNTSTLFSESGNYKKVLWPQAWQVTVDISDFTPNTFNTLQHYLRFGSCLTSLMKATRNYGDVYQKVDQKIRENNAKKNAGAK